MTTATELSDIDSMSFDPYLACRVEAFRDALVRMRDGEDLTVEDLDTAADLLQMVQATKGDSLAAEVMPLFREVFHGGRDCGTSLGEPMVPLASSPATCRYVLAEPEPKWW
ncbi:hypothetical protein ACFV8Z_40620 [Streptomyces sp. NPDC059837]|uniref:hypothetical protein n=1 Tax=Streptomyces sp. NPDC059837 TaxID=3346968 RepID=UPI00365B428C